MNVASRARVGMPLSVRCTHCGWLFRVDSVFAGGRARCKHCGGVTDVPPDPHADRAQRPMRPAGRQPRVRPHAATPGWNLARIARSLGLRRGIGLVALVAVVVSLGVWQWMNRAARPDASDRIVPHGDVDPRLVAHIPPDNVLKTLAPAFLGRPLVAPRTAWLVDGGAGMAPYYADVTTLIATSMALLKPGDQKLALCLAGENAADSLPPVSAGPSALEAARTAMRKFQAGGHVDLAPSFSQVVSWSPDVIFLVLSQPTSEAARDDMLRQARAAGITVHVASVGEQAYFGWRSLAEETHGSFVRLDSRELGLWIDRATRPPSASLDLYRPRGQPLSSPADQ